MTTSQFDHLPDGFKILFVDIFAPPGTFPWQDDPQDPDYIPSERFAQHGELGIWLDLLGDDASRLFERVDATQHPLPDDVSAYWGVIIGGSYGSANDHEPWRDAVKRWYLTKVHPKINLPVLGVCGGHQLIAVALGGTVKPNPDGIVEIGTRSVYCSSPHASVLFEGIARESESFDANFSHRECVVELPKDSIELARNEVGIQAFRIRNRPTWCVQWHPERTGDMCRWISISRSWWRVNDRYENPPSGLRFILNFLGFCKDMRSNFVVRI